MESSEHWKFDIYFFTVRLEYYFYIFITHAKDEKENGNLLVITTAFRALTIIIYLVKKYTDT